MMHRCAGAALLSYSNCLVSTLPGALVTSFLHACAHGCIFSIIYSWFATRRLKSCCTKVMLRPVLFVPDSWLVLVAARLLLMLTFVGFPARALIRPDVSYIGAVHSTIRYPSSFFRISECPRAGIYFLWAFVQCGPAGRVCR